jgi:hypothetical protein
MERQKDGETERQKYRQTESKTRKELIEGSLLLTC